MSSITPQLNPEPEVGSADEGSTESGFGLSLTWLLNRFGPLLGLIGVLLLFVIIGPESFRSARNFETIARQTTIVGLGALGMTIIMIGGGIDLSVGSMVAMATVVIAWVLKGASVPPFLAATLAVLTCAVCGAANGLLITRLKVVPFIVTLGMMLLVRGAAKGLSHEQKIDAPR